MNKLSTPVINIQNLSKRYRLYHNPRHRLLDAIGLLRDASKYTEHLALDNITLSVQQGEKLGIIGRNGAGKSTLLKLISGVIEPSDGSITVNGAARALLQIGAGFHPEFTGRENAEAYLAQLGITGKQAAELIYDITEFAEIEEYIDQPIKTYSTGMAARLMFATSTAITPELLILDEILSVGDAYFTQKSFERINELCKTANTTLLLVSHDIYSTARLCDRMIWVDHGKIVLDAAPKIILQAYEDSIRMQEEERLRKKKRLQFTRDTTSHVTVDDFINVEIHAKDYIPQACKLYISEISLWHNHEKIAELPLTTELTDTNQSHLDFTSSCWDTAISLCQGVSTRAMLNYGHSHHKVAGWLRLPKTINGHELMNCSLLIKCYTEQVCEFVVTVFHGEKSLLSSAINTSENCWQEYPLAIVNTQTPSNNALVNTHGIYGSHKIAVNELQLLNEDNIESYQFKHGAAMKFKMRYTISDRNFNEKPQILISIFLNDTQCVCRYYTTDLHFTSQNPSGHITVNIPKLYLCDGKYSVSIFISKENYFEEEPTQFFSINPDVYFSQRGVVEFNVSEKLAYLKNTVCAFTDNIWEVTPLELTEHPSDIESSLTVDA